MSENGSEGDLRDDIPTIGIYEGERNEVGARHGKGKNTYPNGDVYEGQYHSGKRQGTGDYRFKNGARYVGEFEEGLKHGKGTFYYPDGSKYEGSFVKGKRHGQGTYTYFNGDSFMGEWEADLKHGHGVYSYAQSGTKKEGNWVENVLRGPADIHYADHRVQASFVSSDHFDMPAKMVFRSTGYEVSLQDPDRFDQQPLPAEAAGV